MLTKQKTLFFLATMIPYFDESFENITPDTFFQHEAHRSIKSYINSSPFLLQFIIAGETEIGFLILE